MAGLKSRKKDNVLWVHCVLQHESREVRFKVEMVRRLPTALTRQICEAVTIAINKDDIKMNRKEEWNGSRIPELVIQVQNKIVEEEDKSKKKGNRPIRREPPKDDNEGEEMMRMKRVRLMKGDDEQMKGETTENEAEMIDVKDEYIKNEVENEPENKNKEPPVPLVHPPVKGLYPRDGVGENQEEMEGKYPTMTDG